MAYVPLGKYSSALDELIHTLACHWDWSQHHEGDTENFGAYAFKMALPEDDLSDWNRAMLDQECTRIDPEDTELSKSIYGYWIVSENSQGFVTVTKFDDEEQFETAWQAFEDAYNRWADANPED